MKRTRKTNETDITITLFSNETSIQTPIPFFNHMLNAFFFYADINVSIKASGDTDVDDHHLVEDVGIVLGGLFRDYIDSSKTFERFGTSYIPMDESLSRAVVDLSNRPTLIFNATFKNPMISTFTLQNVKEFFKAFVNEAKITLHLENLYGENDHHKVESLFKASGKALKAALKDVSQVQSTKGSL
jgi:imidazoleglycerol-phosphate dehydratase